MIINEYLNILKKRSAKVLIFIGIFLLIALLVSLVQPLKYRASSRLLIIQNSANSDPYAVAKSNQYLGSLLSETIISGSFFELMAANNNSGIDWSYFNGDYKQKIKKWRKTVIAKSMGDTGILSLEIYHPNPSQARQISIAAGNLLIQQKGLYSDTKNFSLKIIDQPVLSSWPVKPNIARNTVLSIIFGLIFSLIYIYYFPHSQKNKSHKIKNEFHSIKVHVDQNTNHAHLTHINSSMDNSAPQVSKSEFRGNIQNLMD